MTDFRALCAELLSALKNAIRVIYGEDGTKHISTADPVIAKADAALAQSEPEGPSKSELRQLFDDQSGYIDEEQVMWWADFHKAVQVALERWGK